ncbi:hypothetical protein J6590_001604 [Homalodisca vitripennis]|nr:hypothetical protein J6590_001604 [Homalodisca vitripennis]
MQAPALTDESHSCFANLNSLPALESVIELGGLPVKRQKLVNAVNAFNTRKRLRRSFDALSV